MNDDMAACTGKIIYLDVCGEIYVIGNEPPMPLALPGASCAAVEQQGF